MKMKYTKIPALTLFLVLICCLFPSGAQAVGQIGGGGGGGSPAAVPTALTVSYNANGSEAGSIPATVNYAAGALVSVQSNTGVLTKTGYVFSGWNTKADGTGTAYFPSSTFTMPSVNVVLYAGWVMKEVSFNPAQWPVSDKNYNVAYSASDGQSTIVPTSFYYQAGNEILYKTPVAGTYGAKYNFVGFDDILQNYWASEYIWFLSARTVINGVGNNLYAPDQNVTRAAFVKMLQKITPGGDNDAVPATSFADVKSGDWFEPSVNWAVANKIATGYSDGKFGPNDPITREQMCKMISAYTAYIGYDLGAINAPAAFSDGGSISAWAADAAEALQQSGLITGKDNNMFDPQGVSTRSQAATVVCRLLMGILSAMDNPTAIPAG